eukprot:GHVN01019698.1.p1 GENE.GHVN01019698.1~~GHVN01019698.1.p1  ORF type:complete len:368 (-),score=61.48 GHVN01019698.1:450-1553(-)
MAAPASTKEVPTSSEEGDATLKEADAALKEAEQDEKLRARLRVEVKAEFEEVKRDKSIARINKLTNKFRRFSEADGGSVLEDVMKLDLSMYLSEIVDALSEMNVKLKDIPTIMEIIVLLHRQYGDEFTKLLPKAFLKPFEATPSVLADVSASDASGTIGKRKSAMRLYAELFLVGVFDSYTPLETMITSLCSSTASGANLYQNMNILESFCKRMGPVVLGCISRREIKLQKEAAGRSIERVQVFTSAQSAELLSTITTYAESQFSIALKESNSALLLQEQENQQLQIQQGNIDNEALNRYQAIKSNHEKLELHLASICDSIDIDPPQGIESSGSKVTRIGATPQLACQPSPVDLEALGSVWEDEAER